jgi:hypothetical protein
MTMAWARRDRRVLPLGALALLALGAACQRMVPVALPPVLVQPAVAPPASQNPSPMVEETRQHLRLPAPSAWSGWRDSLAVPGLARPAWLLVPARDTAATTVELLALFHGAVSVAQAAADSAPHPTAVLAVSVGSGGTAYDGAFARDSAALWPALLAAVEDALARRRGAPVTVTRRRLAGFSAGYGAIRAILREPALAARVDGVLLLDGLHTGYLPERTPLAEGGAVDTVPLLPFVAYARRAVAGEVALFVSHSEVFPGTFASTTECAGWLLARAGVPRQPVLAWGPVGMQQTSVARRGRLEVRGFAGNAAPDHLDHLHALPQWVREGVGR